MNNHDADDIMPPQPKISPASSVSLVNVLIYTRVGGRLVVLLLH